MPTVGRTTTTGNNFWQQNTGSQNQIGMLIQMPEAGLIRTLHVYVSGNGAAITGQLCLWDYPTGNLVAQTGNITFSSGGTGVNGQALQSANLLIPYAAASGQNLYLGFWRASGSTANYSWINSGGTIRPDVSGAVANVGAPTTLSVSTGTVGQLTAYADYVKGGLALASGGTFSKYALKRWNAGASAMQRHPLKRWNAGNSTWEWFA